MKKMIKIGIIGVGYFGEKHLQNLIELKNIFKVVGLHDSNLKRAKEISETYNVKLFTSIEKLTQECDAINITASTSSHYEILKFCIKKEKHIFIEKPVSEKIKETEELLQLSKNYKQIIQIGFIERFNDAFLSLLSLDFSVKKIKAIRTGNITNRNKNNCIIQDMMIHDIDIINHLIPGCINKIVVHNDSQKDKIMCEIEFENNCFAEIKTERSKLINRENSERKIIITTNNDDQIIVDLLSKQIYWNKKELEKTITKPNALKNELTYFYESIVKKTINQISMESAFESAIIASKIREKANQTLL
jgi:predicted dehydrogenase